MTKAVLSFLTSESGAITVDWVVLTAAIVGIGVASAAAVRTGTTELGQDVEASLTNASVATLTGTNGLAVRLDLASYLGSSPVTASTNRGIGRNTDFRVENVVGPDGAEEAVLVWRDSTNGVTWMDLPEEFTGNLSHLMGASVGFDAWVMDHRDGTNPITSQPVFAIAGANGITLEGRVGTPPNTTEWTNMSVGLQAQNWRVAGTNRVATEAELRSVLEQVDTIQARGEYFAYYDQMAFRNIAIE
jgi:hypothetical protein